MHLKQSAGRTLAMEDLYGQFDENGDHALDFAEFAVLARVMEPGQSEEGARRVYASMDKDEDQSLSVDEFVAFVAQKTAGLPQAKFEAVMNNMMSRVRRAGGAAGLGRKASCYHSHSMYACCLRLLYCAVPYAPLSQGRGGVQGWRAR